MTVPTIDWVVMWKFFHFYFFWIYATLGIMLRLVLVRSFKMLPSGKTKLYVVMSTLASSLLCTWFPIFPVILGGELMLAVGSARGTAIGESLLMGGPLVAVSMGIETAIVDVGLAHWLWEESARRRFIRLLVTNVLNASIALAVSLAWAFHHLPTFIAG